MHQEARGLLLNERDGQGRQQDARHQQDAGEDNRGEQCLHPEPTPIQ